MELNNIVGQLEELQIIQTTIKDNKTVCRLIKIHLKSFYDNIYIPYDHFNVDDWDIDKVLNENEDALFYSKIYLTSDDEDKFYQVFDKYVIMIKGIMSKDNHLFSFLKKWTDTSHNHWKSFSKKSYLKTLLTCEKYKNISPNYVANLFCQVSKENYGDISKIKLIMKEKLDELVKMVKMEIKIFKKIYKDIIRSYVFEYPINDNNTLPYVKGFINSLIIAIINFSEKMIDLNIYSIHTIINDIISCQIPLDEIIMKQDENIKKILII